MCCAVSHLKQECSMPALFFAGSSFLTGNGGSNIPLCRMDAWQAPDFDIAAAYLDSPDFINKAFVSQLGHEGSHWERERGKCSQKIGVKWFAHGAALHANSSPSQTLLGTQHYHKKRGGLNGFLQFHVRFPWASLMSLILPSKKCICTVTRFFFAESKRDW